MNIDCPRAKGAYLEDAPDTIWTEADWRLEPKKDGERETMQIGAERSLIVGRNRQDFLKGVAAAGAFRDHSDSNPFLKRVALARLDGTMLDGELTETYKKANKKGVREWTKKTAERIEMRKKVGFHVWDCLFWKGVDIREKPLIERRAAAMVAVDMIAPLYDGYGQIEMLPQFVCSQNVLQRMFHWGYEGAIAKNILHPIPITQRTHSGWWKLKGDDNRTVDGFVVDVAEGSEGGSGLTGVKPKPNEKAVSFTMAMFKNGKRVDVAKMMNLPDDAVRDGLKHFHRYKMEVAEFIVSGWDGSRFRWPRFVRWRPDKTPNDCRFEEQVGGRNGKGRRGSIR